MKKRFTGNTRLFLMLSGAIMVVALVMQLVGFGLNLGIDFTGGSILEYSVGENFDVNDVETILASVGYADAQITKAAPSDASTMLQAQNAAEAAADTAETEETAEESATPSIISMDKSGVKEDGLTDLQIRLILVDDAAGLDVCATEAVQGVVSGAQMLKYEQLTYLSVTEGGYDKNFTGGFVAEFDMGAEFDLAAVETAVNDALAEGGYSVNNIAFSAYDPADAEAETGAALRVLIDLDDVTSQVRSVLETEMAAKYPGFHFISIDHVSAIAGRDLLSNAVKALLLAFVLMLVYIAIRFDVFSGLAALAALLHDVAIMCAFMVFFRGFFQVNSSFIAAILTIVGYSINNTIIIFDRIRENAKKPGLTQLPRMEIVEISVSSTLSRTINTTLTTMISPVCLYIFGVESIREFAFPLIVGMLAGTYSSVLLSGQVWAMWMEKHMAKKEAAKKAAKKA